MFAATDTCKIITKIRAEIDKHLSIFCGVEAQIMQEGGTSQRLVIRSLGYESSYECASVRTPTAAATAIATAVVVVSSKTCSVGSGVGTGEGSVDHRYIGIAGRIGSTCI